MSLIKKASYLADKSWVTFGHDFKHFTSVQFEEKETECVFVGTSHMFNEKVDREGDNSWSGPKSGSQLGNTGTVFATTGG